jgi:hypothetical protein
MLRLAGRHRSAAFGLVFLAVVSAPVAAAARPSSGPSTYDAFVALFAEWRGFQTPPRVAGVPDYSVAAMKTQAAALPNWQRRLAAIDTSGWTIAQRVDWHIVRAEMAGLEFDHRVLRPWANNPAFYVTVFDEQSDQPAREGPLAAGAVEVWAVTWPLTAPSASSLDAGIRSVPGLLAQARRNLTGNGRDLWVWGAKSLRAQSAVLHALREKTAGFPGPLTADIAKAIAATDSLATWVDAQLPTKTGTSGIGVANYDWYLQHVQLVPLTWAEEVALMERELARAKAFLALEERRNAGVPEPIIVGSAEEHAQRFGAAVSEYMQFLRSRDVMTLPDYLEPALRAKVGSFSAGPREFFTEVDYRDPEVMRTHGYHWFDLARLAKEPPASPVRKGPLLYNIFNTRTEGNATGWEELMLQLGMFDARPRSRELIYIMLAERAARALGDLRMHSGEFTLEQAAVFASAETPRGWLSLSGGLVRGEQHLYLQQPGYGTSYVIGKIEVERIISMRRAQLGATYSLRRVMDEFNAAGLIPASLLRWELTGVMSDDIRRMLSNAK